MPTDAYEWSLEKLQYSVVSQSVYSWTEQDILGCTWMLFLSDCVYRAQKKMKLV